MFTISNCVYNTTDKPKTTTTSRGGKHWRQYSRGISQRKSSILPKQDKDVLKIEKLEKQLERYKEANSKLKTIAGWNVRAAQSAFKDSQDIFQILEELYGEDAYESN